MGPFPCSSDAGSLQTEVTAGQALTTVVEWPPGPRAKP